MSLMVRGLKQHFGGVRAVDDVTFDVAPGQAVALIGPNGAGKSTTFACIAGQIQAQSGQVTWRNQSLRGLPPQQRLALGVVRTFQVAQTFEALSLLQNIELCIQYRHVVWQKKYTKNQLFDEAQAILDAVGLKADWSLRVQVLPYGAKKRLELAMAMAGLPHQGAGLFLLDEPAAGLSATERGQMMSLIKKISLAGHAVLYTEHNMDAVFGVADRVLVLTQGRLIANGLPHEVASQPEVRRDYLGESFSFKGACDA